MLDVEEAEPDVRVRTREETHPRVGEPRGRARAGGPIELDGAVAAPARGRRDAREGAQGFGVDISALVPLDDAQNALVRDGVHRPAPAARLVDEATHGHVEAGGQERE